MLVLLRLRDPDVRSAFVVVYAIDAIPHQTQFLGLALGLALAFLAAALRRDRASGSSSTEELEEDYPPAEHPSEQEAIEQIVDESGDALHAQAAR